MATHLFYLASTSPAPASTAVLPLDPTSTHSSPAPSRGPGTAAERTTAALHLLIAYESGQLALFRFTPTRSFDLVPVSPPIPSSSSSTAFARQRHPHYLPREGVRVDESEGWELVWVEKGHRDASECFLAPLSLSLSRRRDAC